MNRFEWLFQKSVALMILFLLLVFPSGEILAAANYDSLESMTNGILVSEKDMIDGYYQFSPIISEASEIRFSDN